MLQWIKFDHFYSFRGDGYKNWRDCPAEDLVTRMHEQGDCGTAACLAGHAAILKAAAQGDHSNRYNGHTCREEARKWLGLTEQQAHDLFEPRNERDNLIWFNSKNAIDTLERLRDTGRVDWQDPRVVSLNFSD